MVFLYLRDKKFSERYDASLLSSLRIPLQQYGHIPLTEFTTQTWDELVKLLRRTEKSRGAGLISTAFVHNILSALRTIFRWAGDRGLVESLPKMKVPAANYARTIPPTPEEAQRIFSVAPEHLKRVIVLGMMLGLRVWQSELLALKWNHVYLVKKVVSRIFRTLVSSRSVRLGSHHESARALRAGQEKMILRCKDRDDSGPMPILLSSYSCIVVYPIFDTPYSASGLLPASGQHDHRENSQLPAFYDGSPYSDAQEGCLS